MRPNSQEKPRIQRIGAYSDTKGWRPVATSAILGKVRQTPGDDVPKTTSIHLRKIKRPLKGDRVRCEWHLRWFGTDGKHYCHKLGDCNRMTKREAEAKRRTFQVEIDRSTIPRDKPKAMALGEFAEYHATMIGKDRKPSTLYEYQLSARLASQILGTRKPIQEITQADVGRFRNHLKGSPATRAKHLSRLRAMFGHAKRWGLIHGDNPFANQPMPRFGSRKMRIFLPEEIDAMLAVAGSTWWHSFILIGATAGLRKEEMLNLIWSDVDLNEKTVCITVKKADEITVADDRQYEMLAWSPKTYETRTVPIPDRTVESLRRLKRESDGSPYLFVDFERLALINRKMREGLWRDRAETCNNVLRGFQAIQRRAAKHIDCEDWAIGNIHDLRRTYGTRLADVVPMHVLQKWMGHSDPSVTARFYLGQTEHHAARARVVFDDGNGFTAQNGAQIGRAAQSGAKIGYPR